MEGPTPAMESPRILRLLDMAQTLRPPEGPQSRKGLSTGAAGCGFGLDIFGRNPKPKDPVPILAVDPGNRSSLGAKEQRSSSRGFRGSEQPLVRLLPPNGSVHRYRPELPKSPNPIGQPGSSAAQVVK